MMSELSDTRASRRDLRWTLLTTVSALALLGFAYRANQARAADDDADHPTVWIELGGQLERVDGSDERFAPPFLAGITQLGFRSPVGAERAARYSNGGEGKISYEPSGSTAAHKAKSIYIPKRRDWRTDSSSTLTVRFTPSTEMP
jgi:hypothetical protein